MQREYMRSYGEPICFLELKIISEFIIARDRSSDAVVNSDPRIVAWAIQVQKSCEKKLKEIKERKRKHAITNNILVKKKTHLQKIKDLFGKTCCNSIDIR